MQQSSGVRAIPALSVAPSLARAAATRTFAVQMRKQRGSFRGAPRLILQTRAPLRTQARRLPPPLPARAHHFRTRWEEKRPPSAANHETARCKWTFPAQMQSVERGRSTSSTPFDPLESSAPSPASPPPTPPCPARCKRAAWFKKEKRPISGGATAKSRRERGG